MITWAYGSFGDWSPDLSVFFSLCFPRSLYQALPVVYLPVWVDSFAPEGKKTRWIAFSQLGSIGGEQADNFVTKPRHFLSFSTSAVSRFQREGALGM